MLSYIPSFYLLQRLTTDEWSRRDAARAAFEEMADSLATCFRDYLFMACLGESRHSLAKTGVGFDGFAGKERDEVYKFANRYAISEDNIKSLVDIFDESHWGKKPGYGGKKWGDLAKIVGQYGSMSNIMFVDAVVNAQHNGGTAFSKSEAANYMDISFNFSLGTLQNFLNFRRTSPDILSGFTTYFTNVSMTTGKLAIAHCVECHSALDVSLLRPLEDHVYKPVKWGKLSLPKVIKMKRICHSCSKSFDDAKKCPECGYVFCYKCYGDGDNCSECSGITELGRCSVCLQQMDKHDSIETACGIYVHKYCANHHRSRCATCHQNKLYEYNGASHDECAYCHLPISNDDEHWTTYSNSYCHRHCFHLIKDNPHGDYVSSKDLFDKIASLCPICKMPVLKDYAVPAPDCGHYDTDQMCHNHCVMLHKIDCADSTLCDCSSCTAEQGVWKQIKQEIALTKESHVKTQKQK